jgi:hypothetical protein
VRLGESCAPHRPDELCIGLSYVVYRDPQGRPVSTESDALENLQGTNDLGKSCGIQFQIEGYREVDPREHRLPYGGSAAMEACTRARKEFTGSSRFLLVTTGAWGTVKNAWTASPGTRFHGAVMEGGIARGYPEIYAHELGHYLDLDHEDSDAWNLMSPVIRHSTHGLRPDQCARARAAARRLWPSMLR